MRVIYYNVTQLGSWKVCLPREDPVVWPILLLEMTLASHNMHFCWQPTYKSLANFISELLNCNHMLVMLAPIKSLNSIHISYLIIAQCNHLFLSPRYEHSKRIKLMIPVNFSMRLYTLHQRRSLQSSCNGMGSAAWNLPSDSSWIEGRLWSCFIILP